MSETTKAIPAVRRSDLERFFAGISSRLELAESQQRQLNRTEAKRFNVFGLIDPDENKLSDILADLLDPEGDHGQSDLFLRLFLQQLGVVTESTLTSKATVRREAPTHGIRKYRRRMDVFIDAGALVAIENKVDSPEQEDQVKDYLAHLRFCTRRRTARTALIYLTPGGGSPDSLAPSELEKEQANGALHCWSYQDQLLTWLKACHKKCQAPRIQQFLADFIAYVESHLHCEPSSNQEQQSDENRPHPRLHS